MSFRQPIVAGNVLVRNAIQSPNYLAGSMGWIIRRDGSAEFSNAIFRGSVVISGSNNLLMYSGAPAAGDLVIALAPNAGSDGFGNVYAQGLTIGTAGGFQLVLGLTGGSPLMYFPTGRAAITNSSAFQTIVQGAGAAQYEQLQALGAQDSTQKDAVDTAWSSSSPDGTQQPQILDFYHDPLGGFHFYRVLNFAGNASTGPTTAVQPGTGTSRANPAVGETWHTAALAAGWANNGTLRVLQYRMTPDGDVEVCGCVVTNSATPTAAITTLPVGYRPTNDTRILAAVQRGTPDVAISADIGTSGIITLLNNPTATSVGLYFSFRLPLN